ncbi:LysR family transcriptional regulator [Hydrogenophaga soli]
MRRKIPTTQALACFEAAARHGSFTRAAQELNLTQGAISRQVAALEDFLGVPLFKRGQHGMALTPAGVDYARRVSRQLDALERDTLDLMGRQGEGDALTLAVVPTFANRWLIPRLPGLMRLHPELQVHIEVRTRPFLFTDSGVDAAVYAGTPEQVQQWVGVEALPLLAEQVVPVCSPGLLTRGRTWTPHELAQAPLLQPATRPEAWRQWFDALGVDAPKAMAGPRYELFSMQATAAAAGLGVALMPTLLIQDELARGTLVVACDERRPSGRHYCLVQPSRPERPALAAFRDWLVQQVAGAVGVVEPSKPLR